MGYGFPDDMGPRDFLGPDEPRRDLRAPRDPGAEAIRLGPPLYRPRATDAERQAALERALADVYRDYPGSAP